MAKQTDALTSISNKDSDFANLQLKECIETFRSQFNLLIQIFTVFMLANVTILGFAISNQISGILLVGAIIPILLLYVAYGGSKFMLPVLYTAILLEKKYGERNTDYLASTFISTMISVDFLNRLQEISRIKNFDERTTTLKRQKFTLIYRRKFRALLIFISIGQVAVAILLNIVFSWPLF
jgi:hypothetical protein